MNREWRLVTIGEVAKLQGGYAFKSKDFSEGGIPVVKIKNIQNRTATLQDSQCFPQNLYSDKLVKFILNNGDILIAMTGAGSVGRVGKLICSANAFGLLNQRVGRFDVDVSKIIKDFLFYTITLPRYQEALFKAGSGSGQPNLSPKQIESIELNLPPLQEQKNIAKILGDLDDKIELNRKMNQTLEQMAQALFKQWFVNFEYPNEQGKPYKSSGGVMVYNEVLDNKIPMGWLNSSLGEEFNVIMGQSPPGSSYNEDENGIAFFQGRRDFEFRFPSNRVYCTEPKRFAKKNDTLLSVRAPVGDLNMASNDCCIGRGISALKHKLGSRSYTYYNLLEVQKMFESFDSEGTVFGSINQTNLKAICVLKPSDYLINKFEELCFPIDQKIEVNSNQIDSLIKQRDTLLPQLISGKLRLN